MNYPFNGGGWRARAVYALRKGYVGMFSNPSTSVDTHSSKFPGHLERRDFDGNVVRKCLNGPHLYDSFSGIVPRSPANGGDLAVLVA